MSDKLKCYQCGEDMIKPISTLMPDGNRVCSTECVRAFNRGVTPTSIINELKRDTNPNNRFFDKK